ncbi:MAG: glycosyltransferase [Candidatus Riflebacteria bacterium]|nr:glycosyltransferase [Candidatus Riflebacteria bacterium]
MQEEINEKTEENRPLRLCFEGDYGAPSASGRIIRELILALRSLELPVSLNEHRSYGPEAKEILCPPIIKKVADRPSTGRLRLFCLPAASLPPEHERGIFLALCGFHPYYLSPYEAKKLNKAKKVWVYSKKHLETFQKPGMRRSSAEVFEPTVNSRVFNPKARSGKEYFDPRPFSFIIIGNPLYRKGIDTALRAYIEEFKAKEPVNLVIKLSNLPRPKKHLSYEIPDLTKRLGALNSYFPKVTVINSILNDDDLAGLFASCDAYLSCGRSYHTALPEREAMSCGLPLIAPAYLADLLDFSEENGFPADTVNGKIPEGMLFSNSPEINSQEVSIESLRKQMRLAFSKVDLLKQKAEKARRTTAKWKSWKELASQINQCLIELSLDQKSSGRIRREISKGL